MEDPVLREDEVRKVVGYRQPAAQLAELHRQGFWRARRCPVTGRVILERPHYEAVARGEDAKPAAGRRAPQLRLA